MHDDMKKSVDEKKKEVKQALEAHRKDETKDGEQQKEQAQMKDAKESKDAKIDELVNDLKRVQADFENYRKRVERDNAKLCEYSKADLIKRLLAVLDSFEIALKNTSNHEEFVKGVELIYSQLYTLLKDEGLQHIEAVGKKLDPYLHEVMLFGKSDKEEDTILEELQKGYKLKGAVIRHSKVKVAKG